MRKDDIKAFILSLREYRFYLTRQQLQTIKGQAYSGDLEAAKKGLKKILQRNNNLQLAHNGAKKINKKFDTDYRSQLGINLKHIKEIR